jgi:hypothetical protein
VKPNRPVGHHDNSRGLMATNRYASSKILAVHKRFVRLVTPKRFVAFVTILRTKILSQLIRNVKPKKFVGLHDNYRRLMGTNRYPSLEIFAHNLRHVRLVMLKRLPTIIMVVTLRRLGLGL